MTWRTTPAERRALVALSRDVPRHPGDLIGPGKMLRRTLARLCNPVGDRPPLVQRLELKPAWGFNLPYYPFYHLTEAGEAARRAAAR